MSTAENASWRRASYSANGGNCVEVRQGAVTGIRDTQNRQLGHLSAPVPEWTALLAAVRAE